jgi:signal transduction histidine kinase
LASKLKQTAGYVAVVAGCFGVAMVAAWTSPAIRIDNQAYDWMLTRSANESWIPQSVVVKIDEETLGERGGIGNLRNILSETLDRIKEAGPKAVVSDVLLNDAGRSVDDKRLAASLRATRNLVLPCDVIRGTAGFRWESPLPQFKESAVALGHVDLPVDRFDGMSRWIPLDDRVGSDQRWALALEAFSVTRGQPIIESPEGVQVGGTFIPAPRGEEARAMSIRYLASGIPRVSALSVDQHPEMIRGKTVFVGVTANGTHDSAVTPYGEMFGVEIHAQAFETIARGKFLAAARNDLEFLLCAAIAIGAGLIFALRSGWQAYTLGGVLIAGAVWMPFQFFRYGIVFPFFAPVAVAWMATMGASVFQHFFVRRKLRRTESEKSRYQQAIHWAAHEMRSPLTAIQGSSEIMTRYELPEAKRGELSAMINSESKRLARMIQTFLDVERLADGQMELKREPFAAAELLTTCIIRATPIAERKKSHIFLDNNVDGVIVGDRELMEYALYNLLTNAVKYSPPESEVHVATELLTGKSGGERGELRIHVRDHGIGMDAKELKSIFQKFYRTKRAEASGEAGTGIGLSIVDQIVSHHGGRMEVTSEPQKGSCFTMIIAASESAVISPNGKTPEKTADRRG